MASSRRKRRKNRRPSPLPYVIIIVVAVVLVLAILFISTRPHIDGEDVSVVELTHTTQDTDETEEERVQQDSNPEITALMERLLNAIRDGDIDTLNDIIVRDTELDADSITAEARYIEGFDNISCYTIDGLVDGTYIVYLYYEERYLNIGTAVPDLHRYYVCTNDDGTLYIDMREHDGEVDAYMEEVSQWPEIQALVSDVNTKLQDAVNSDAALADFITRLQNGTLTEELTEAETAE
ncbi:MAG: hypothetical protein ACOX8B_06815 [Lachnospiraceae bacterium]|jgi:hypothetical protein